MTDKLIFWAVYFFANSVQGVTGFAGGLICNPVGFHLFGIDMTLTICNFIGIFSAAAIVFTSWKNVMWKEVAKVCAVMLVFMVIGRWVAGMITFSWLLRIFGIFVIAVAVRNLFFSDEANLKDWQLIVVLAAAGMIQGMYVCGGALLVIYALHRFRDKMKFRATMSAVWLVLNSIYFAYFASLGMVTADVVQITAVCIPIVFITTYIGAKIAKRINQESFLKFVYVLLLLIGISSLVTA